MPLGFMRCSLLIGVLFSGFGAPSSFASDEAKAPLVIAHRGASGYLPEHTLEAYAMAYAQGADYIEPDLVMTQDKVLICLHDIHLEATTDVESRFPDRHRQDGKWYAADFRLDEIKSLRVHERTSGRFPQNVSEFRVPTFVEMIQLIQGLNTSTGKATGIYPELKDPAWLRENGLPLEEAFLKIAREFGYDAPDANIFVQCFEPEPLERLRTELGSTMPQILLIGGGQTAESLLTAEGLSRIARFANGIGPAKNLIERNPALVAMAHEHGLQVHPYTLRADDVPSNYASHEAEIAQFCTVFKVDGFFTDFPDRARRWLDTNHAPVGN